MSRFANGRPRAIIEYKQGVLHGPSQTWHENGQPKSAGTFAKGKYQGAWTFWEAGGTRTQAVYDDGKKVTGDNDAAGSGVDIVEREPAQPRAAPPASNNRPRPEQEQVQHHALFQANCAAPRLIIVLQDGEVVDGTFIKEVKLGLLVETKEKTLLVKTERITDVEARCAPGTKVAPDEPAGARRVQDDQEEAPSRPRRRADPATWDQYQPSKSTDELHAPSLQAGLAAVGAMLLCGVGPVGGLVAWLAATNVGKRRIPILPIVGAATLGAVAMGCVNTACTVPGVMVLGVGSSSSEAGAILVGAACMGVGAVLSGVTGIATMVTVAVLAARLGRGLMPGEDTFNLDWIEVPDSSAQEK